MKSTNSLFWNQEDYVLQADEFEHTFMFLFGILKLILDLQ